MHRLNSLYRLACALNAAWTWRPPRGVYLYVAVDWRRREASVLIHDETIYLANTRPLGSTRAAIHDRLDELAAVLAQESKLLDSIPVAPTPEPGLCPSSGYGGAEFETVMRRLREKGHILPFGEAKKGGACHD